ncbi:MULTISPECIES: hypothetical protein [Streptomyces]|uniref:Uncharacterized protein n=3 Tax=Streptomyces rimosus TaxID=1927 RepID=L8EU86_STRR1|nr:MULTISPECIES: hypothetical protein [Streptomyces]KOG84172.1 hypothetical protein ADK78_00850 [Kitasatospora aureofaciens]MYT44909.1 hypothetical protein [Streptomyces sp. SID5471]KOT27941.1 hypothetical protein ADK84_37245 [Streptomyces sp. NRRL WC-3701]KOT42239.1 hypothetical protein ADK42_10010 [Streptomyces rimosus subsp. rimosus]KOT68537.1 hypothetical protein ADK44_00675 [Streptomyces rimosus subsp. rimosus]
MTRCDDCGRLLRRPSPDGLGPVCRRKHVPEPDRRGSKTSRPVADPGQLTIPIQTSFSDCEPSWARPQPSRRRRGPITTVPGPDTWPLPGGTDHDH